MAAVDISADVQIRRSRAEVAAFMFDPKRDTEWTTGLVEARPQSSGLLATGMRIERVAQFLGRRMHSLIEVTEAEPSSFVEMRCAEPFEMIIRYELEDAADGATLARIRCSGEGTGFFRMAAPLLSRMVRRSVVKDLKNLQRCLEG